MDRTMIFFGAIVPALMVLGGWWAYSVGYYDAVWFLYSSLTPALVSVLGWGAVVLNEIAMKRAERRDSHSTVASNQPSISHLRMSAPLDHSDLPDRDEPDRLVDAIDVINLVLPWAGSTARAVAWYQSQPLPGFGGQTAKQLVDQGRVHSVKAYLSRVAPADLL